MKAWKIVLKIVAALAAIAGAVYLIATYGDKIVAWAKGLLNRAKCGCTCEGDCDACECEDDCTECKCECECDACDTCECAEEAIEEAAEEVAEAAEEAAEEVAEEVAEEKDFQ